ncbi:MAG: isocitrate lyase/phosphoenolpyruvate mutase family protein [Acidobacteriota bacterium]|nr:isocitrate lyase/phosphoenolpyruvate mutase family protein [Acidobacteriota bacterium]
MNEIVARFRQLHESGCFVIPNPWDAGSARLLEQLGFPALATTSSGFAWSTARADNHVTLEDALAHFRTISSAVHVPVSGDFEGGFAVAPAEVAANVSAAAATGVAGLSIEDSTGDPNQPLFEFELAVERVRAAREANREIVLTARCEAYLTGRSDLDEVTRRLTAYAAAGADCLYAPGMRDLREIDWIVNAVAPKAVNVLVGADFTNVEEMRSIGVRRISVGGALARAAWKGFLDAAQEIAQHGTFTRLAQGVPFAEIDGKFER